MDENFMVPVDSPAISLKEDAKRYCLSLDFVLRSLDEHLDRESLIIILLDCCRENPLIDVKSMRVKGHDQIHKGLSAVNLKTNPDSSTVFLGFAAAPGARNQSVLLVNMLAYGRSNIYVYTTCTHCLPLSLSLHSDLKHFKK